MKFPMLLAIGALSSLALTATTQAQINTAGTAFSDHATLPKGIATLNCNLLEYETWAEMTAHVREAGPFGFALWMQPGISRIFNPMEAEYVGFAPTNADGEGLYTFPCRLPDAMLEEQEVVMFAVYRDAAGKFFVSDEEPFALGVTRVAILDFNENLMGHAIPAGREIRGQWGFVGIEISAVNNTPGHPDKAIIYDSSDPFGADPDLTTPGAGFMNDQAYGNLLVIAEQDVDLNGDRLIDVPDDEKAGGVITFTFSKPVQVYKVVLVDVDMNEFATLSCFDGDTLVADVEVQPMGNNSVERIGMGAELLTRFEVALSGSGGIAELWLVGQVLPDHLFPETPVLTFP